MCTNISNKVFLSLLVFSLSACIDAGPYIYKADEFNRRSADFGVELKDRSKVEICYNKWSTTPEILTQMAKDECGHFGKLARFVSNQDLACSISLPAKAVYWCLCPGESIRDRLEDNMEPVKGERKYECSKP